MNQAHNVQQRVVAVVVIFVHAREWPAPGLRTGDHVVISGYEAFGDAEVLEVSITE